MPLQLLLKTPNLLISHDRANNWLYVNWQGTHDQESARACCRQIQAVFEQHSVSKILNDNSNVMRASTQLTPWGVQWLTELHASGLRHAAWVYAPDYPGRTPSEAIVQYLANPIVATFDDLATAHDWLRRQ